MEAIVDIPPVGTPGRVVFGNVDGSPLKPVVGLAGLEAIPLLDAQLPLAQPPIAELPHPFNAASAYPGELFPHDRIGLFDERTLAKELGMMPVVFTGSSANVPVRDRIAALAIVIVLTQD